MAAGSDGSGGYRASPRLKGRVRTRGREVLRSLYILPRLPAARLGLGSLPSFVVIGAQKAGTTSLFRYLSEHPGVTPPRMKEIHFFDLHWVRGVGWYQAHFPLNLWGGPPFTGEASPYYLFHPRVPERMARILPGARVLALLRNPVDRALSHYHWEVRYGNETLPFRRAMDRETEVLPGETARLLADDGYRSFLHQHASYLSRGHYADQLSRWFDHFPPEQFLVLKAEDLFARPGPTMVRVQEFLDLPDSVSRRYPVHREGQYRGRVDVDRRELEEYFRPHNERLGDLLEMDFREWG